MASPTRNARLRIPSYAAPDGFPTGDDGKDLIFRLKARRIQKNLSDGAQTVALSYYNFITLSYSMVKFTITLEGVVEEFDADRHSSHPVSSGTEHDPDWIDLEEAAALWNNQARPGAADASVPSLEIEHDGSGFRTYKGVITMVEMTRREGESFPQLRLVFDVVWSDTNPTLREWS